MKQWLVTKTAPSLRTVGIIGVPESGKTTTAYIIMKKWAKWNRDKYTVFWLDGDRRVPPHCRVQSLREIEERIPTVTTPLLAVLVTDPKLTLAWETKKQNNLVSFVEALWTVRHVNPSLKHILFVFGGQVVTAVAPKIRNLFHLWILKGVGAGDTFLLSQLFGINALRGMMKTLNYRVFVKGEKEWGIVVFPTGEARWYRFRLSSQNGFVVDT